MQFNVVFVLLAKAYPYQIYIYIYIWVRSYVKHFDFHCLRAVDHVPGFSPDDRTKETTNSPLWKSLFGQIKPTV